MITEQQFVDSINESVASMEEGVEYYLNKSAFDSYSEQRKEWGYWTLKREDFIIMRKDGKFWINGNKASDEKVDSTFAFTFPFAFIFALIFARALAFGLPERRHPNTCDGKVVEIDGKKYKLKLV